MKKNFALVLFAFSFLFLNVTYSVEDKPVNKPDVKGGIRKSVEYSYKYKFGQPDIKSKEKQYERTYNEKGFWIECLKFEKNKLYSKGLIKYDDNNNWIEVVWVDLKGNVKHKYTHKYDARGKEIEETSFDAEEYEENYKITYNYNENGDLIEIINYNGDGDIMSKEVNKYDNMNYLIANINYDENGSIALKHTYKNDGKGNALEIVTVNEKGIVTSKLSQKFNSNGKLLEYIGLNEKSTVTSKGIYKYNTDGNLIEGLVLITNEPNSAEQTIYDTKGNKIEINWYKSDKTKSGSNIWKYDSMGNILEEKNYNDKSKDPYWMKINKYDDYGNLLEVIWYDELGEPESKTEFIYSK
jgi:YD repeat-containing protein